MKTTYTVKQRVPGHPEQIVATGLPVDVAMAKMKMLKAASPEVIVEVRAEQKLRSQKGRRG